MTRQVTSRRIYTLAEAAERVGCHDRTITRAEADGRIAPARRDELGHRVYDDGDIYRLRQLIFR